MRLPETVPTSLADLRAPDARDLSAFVRALVSPDAWVGTIADYPGLFFTPNPPPREHAEQARYVTPHRPLRERAEVPSDWSGAHDTLFMESDTLDIPAQLARLANLAIPPPTAAVLSGDPRYGVRGRSVHVFWRIEGAPLPYVAWRLAQLSLLAMLDGDPACLCPWQAMRVGGYQDATRCQTLLTGGMKVCGPEIEALFHREAVRIGEEREAAWLEKRRTRAMGASGDRPPTPLTEYLEAFLRDRGWKLASLEASLWTSPRTGEAKEVDDAVDEEEEHEP